LGGAERDGVILRFKAAKLRPVRRLGYLWLVVPGLGLAELVAHLWFASRAPRSEEWRALASAVLASKQLGEPVVVAPEWAEPFARLAFGDRGFPLAELARPDDAAVARVLEVSALGARYPTTQSWRVVSASAHGRFTLRVLENPAPLRVGYRFIEHVNPRDLGVTVVAGGREEACRYTDHAPVAAGGLHGEVAFPRERFVCGRNPASFVGVTVIDDQNYRPRQCIWAQPPPGATLRLTFAGVPFGSALRGFGGLSYFLFRDSDAPPVTLDVASDGVTLGSYVHEDAWGWHPFRFGTEARRGRTGSVDVALHAGDASGRDFCFTLEVLE
jgi:hypothetical protein